VRHDVAETLGAMGYSRPARFQSGEAEVRFDASARDAVLHVLDRGSGFYRNAKLPANAFSENGRGLFLVEAMVDDLIVSPRPSGGSHVRAVLRRHGALDAALDATVDEKVAS
jgi:hypothetical protein